MRLEIRHVSSRFLSKSKSWLEYASKAPGTWSLGGCMGLSRARELSQDSRILFSVTVEQGLPDEFCVQNKYSYG